MALLISYVRARVMLPRFIVTRARFYSSSRFFFFFFAVMRLIFFHANTREVFLLGNIVRCRFVETLTHSREHTRAKFARFIGGVDAERRCVPIAPNAVTKITISIFFHTQEAGRRYNNNSIKP